MKALDEAIRSKIERSFKAQSFMNLIRAELRCVEAGYVEIMCGFNKSFLQQNGFLHGAALAGIADTACGYACISLAEFEKDMLTVEYKINFLRPAIGEYFIAKANVIKDGTTFKIATCSVSNDQGREIAFMTASVMVAK